MERGVRVYSHDRGPQAEIRYRGTARMTSGAGYDRRPALPGQGAITRISCLIAQPLLTLVVRRIAARHPSLFARLGPHQQTNFLIDPVDLPFALHLRPDPKALILRAVPRQYQARSFVGAFCCFWNWSIQKGMAMQPSFRAISRSPETPRPWSGCAMRWTMSKVRSLRRRRICSGRQAGRSWRSCAVPMRPNRSSGKT